MLLELKEMIWIPVWVLAAEGLLQMILQMRTHHLMKKQLRMAEPKRTRLDTIRQETRKGKTDPPVPVYDKPKDKSLEKTEKSVDKSSYDQEEVKILQDMMAEFFTS